MMNSLVKKRGVQSWHALGKKCGGKSNITKPCTSKWPWTMRLGKEVVRGCKLIRAGITDSETRASFRRTWRNTKGFS